MLRGNRQRPSSPGSCNNHKNHPHESALNRYLFTQNLNVPR